MDYDVFEVAVYFVAGYLFGKALGEFLLPSRCRPCSACGGCPEHGVTRLSAPTVASTQHS